MKAARSLLLTAVVALSVFAATIQQAHAILPVLVYSIARQAVFMTAETVAIQVVAKGFAANDPYVRTTATIPRSKLAANLSKMRGPRWVGMLALLATVASYGWDYDDEVGFYTPVRKIPSGGVCVTTAGVTSAESCLAEGEKRTGQTGYQMAEQEIDCSNITGACPNTVMQIGWCSAPPSISQFCEGYITVAMYRYIKGPEEVFKQPVTEKDINEKLLPAIVASPNTIGDMFAGATQQQLATMLDGATVPYNPTNPSPELEQLKSDYRNGLLQSVDPTAPHYVTPDQLKQIQDMVAAEDAANTDDGMVDAINEKMKQPITQAQYEESNKKYSDGIDAVTASLGSQAESDVSDIEGHFNKLDGIITDLPNTSLPAPADISVPQYVDCQRIHLSDGNGHELDFPSPSQCAKIETFKQGFGYFLAVSVVFLLGMQLLTRPHG